MYDKVKDYQDKIKDQVLKLDNLDKFKCMNNNVLIRVDDMHDTITHGTLTLHLDTSYEPGIHAANKGVVVGVPDRYIYSEKPLPNTGDWDTEIEVQPGDQVWFDYLTGIECSKIESNGVLYYNLPYHVLYVAKREISHKPIPGGEYFMDDDGKFRRVIPLNGYVLCEPIINTEKFIDFEIEREDSKYAIIMYAGSCNKTYRFSMNKMGKTFYHDDPEVKVGCKAIYGMPVNLFLEREEHSSFNGDKRYKIVQRRHLLGIVNN